MGFIDNFKEKYFRRKGQKLLTKGKIEKAYTYFRKALLLKNSAENVFNLSVTLMSLGNYAEAEKFLSKIKEQYPENTLNTLSLAECMIMQKKWDKAIQLYQKILKKDPDNPSFKKYLKIAQDPVFREKYVKSKELFNKATLALKQKNDEKALKHLLDANEYFPNEPHVLHNIGSIYFLKKRYKKAYKYILQAYELKKNNPKFKESLKKVKNKL